MQVSFLSFLHFFVSFCFLQCFCIWFCFVCFLTVFLSSVKIIPSRIKYVMCWERWEIYSCDVKGILLYLSSTPRLPGVHHTAKSISAVCITTLSQTPRCASYRRVNCSKFLMSQEHTISQNHRFMHHSEEIDLAVCITPPSQSCDTISLRQP